MYIGIYMCIDISITIIFMGRPLVWDLYWSLISNCWNYNVYTQVCFLLLISLAHHMTNR